MRLSRISADIGDRHEFNEWTVHVMLQETSTPASPAADNSKVLPTDTMKNTVYLWRAARRRRPSKSSPASYGDYLLNNNAQIAKVSVEVEEKAWERMIVDGAPDADHLQDGRT